MIECRQVQIKRLDYAPWGVRAIDERKKLIGAATHSGTIIIERDQAHIPLARDLHELLPEERAIYTSLQTSAASSFRIVPGPIPLAEAR